MRNDFKVGDRVRINKENKIHGWYTDKILTVIKIDGLVLTIDPPLPFFNPSANLISVGNVHNIIEERKEKLEKINKIKI